MNYKINSILMLIVLITNSNMHASQANEATKITKETGHFWGERFLRGYFPVANLTKWILYTDIKDNAKLSMSYRWIFNCGPRSLTGADISQAIPIDPGIYDCAHPSRLLAANHPSTPANITKEQFEDVEPPFFDPH